MKISALLVGILLLMSCGDMESLEEDARQLFRTEAELQCQMDSMRASITAQWDEINRLLDENLPETMPEEERRNMLMVRNANLIRMFQTYESLNDTIKSALQKTEMKDAKMSGQIADLKKELQKVEAEKMKIYAQLKSKRGKKEVERLRKMNKEIVEDRCN